jgi:hypothetical protein
MLLGKPRAAISLVFLGKVHLPGDEHRASDARSPFRSFCLHSHRTSLLEESAENGGAALGAK